MVDGLLAALGLGDIFSGVIRFFLVTSFIWIPAGLLMALLWKWAEYIRLDFIYKKNFILYEIKLPQQVVRSPAGMDLFFAQLWQGVGKNAYESFWLGKHKDWYSVEICSFGGEVHFYVWIPGGMRQQVESALYAQYPDIEIAEAEDYTVPIKEEDVTLLGAYVALTKPDAYPVKTYEDYGMSDKNFDKDEHIVDPLANLVEFFGNARPQENFWLQIIFEQNEPGGEGLSFFRFKRKPDWKQQVREEVKKYTKENLTYSSGNIGQGDDEEDYPAGLQGYDRDILKAMQKSADKFGFNTAIRFIYYTKKPEDFNKGNAFGFFGVMNTFSAGNFNGFKPSWRTDNRYNYRWQDPYGLFERKHRRSMLEAYKLRSFFHLPYKNHGVKKPFVMTTAELATVFHIPSRFVTTPTISRQESRRGDAPANLPT